MSDAEEKLAALERELASLREELARLRAEVAAARGRVGLTMRDQLRCPACGGRKIIHAAEVLDYSGGGKMALQLKSIWTGRSAGRFHVYICASCGLVEWCIPERGDIDIDGRKLRLLDGEAEPGGGPYR